MHRVKALWSASPRKVLAGLVGNSQSGSAILNASGLTPGASQSGTVDIRNTGSATGTFTLAQSNLTDTPASPGLPNKLTMVIVDKHDPNGYAGSSSSVEYDFTAST